MLSIAIGMVSDATELRYSFGGAVITMYIFGIGVIFALSKTFRRDLKKREDYVMHQVAASTTN